MTENPRCCLISALRPLIVRLPNELHRFWLLKFLLLSHVHSREKESFEAQLLEKSRRRRWMAKWVHVPSYFWRCQSKFSLQEIVPHQYVLEELRVDGRCFIWCNPATVGELELTLGYECSHPLFNVGCLLPPPHLEVDDLCVSKFPVRVCLQSLHHVCKDVLDMLLVVSIEILSKKIFTPPQWVASLGPYASEQSCGIWLSLFSITVVVWALLAREQLLDPP